MMATATPVSAQSPAIPGDPRPLTSLTIWTPRPTAFLATSGFMVSTDTGTPKDGRISFSTGASLEISSSAETGDEPGRVDSAPMSIRSAPASSISKAWRAASRGSVHIPPSENESGVTFRIPMTMGGPPGAFLFKDSIGAARPLSPPSP